MHASFFFLFFFQGCQPLLFKDLTLALQSNKNLSVNWLGSANFSGFWCNSVKSSIFHSLAMESSPVCLFVSCQWPKAFCWSRCKGVLLAFPSWVLYCWGKKEDKHIPFLMWQLQLYILSQEFHFIRTCCTASFWFLAWRHFGWNECGEQDQGK